MAADGPDGAGIDPQLLDWLERYPAPSLDYRDVAAVRELTARYMSEQGGLAPRWLHDDVIMTPHRVGGVPTLVWRPRDVPHDRGLPVVVAFHGGAFIVGHPLGAERVAVRLAAEHGIVTVSIGYRLAPEHPAPAALRDAASVVGHLGSLPGVDPSRLALHGSSAGAAIAAGLAAWCRDDGRAVALQSLSCPAIDPHSPASTDDRHSMRGLSPTLTRDAVAAMWHHYLAEAPTADALFAYAVPAWIADLDDLAPAHITIAEYDVLKDEATDYAQRLAAAGVEVRADIVAGAVHGFDGLLPDSRIAGAAIERQVTAIAEALKS